MARWKSRGIVVVVDVGTARVVDFGCAIFLGAVCGVADAHAAAIALQAIAAATKAHARRRRLSYMRASDSPATRRWEQRRDHRVGHELTVSFERPTPTQHEQFVEL